MAKGRESIIRQFAREALHVLTAALTQIGEHRLNYLFKNTILWRKILKWKILRWKIFREKRQKRVKVIIYAALAGMMLLALFLMVDLIKNKDEKIRLPFDTVYALGLYNKTPLCDRIPKID